MYLLPPKYLQSVVALGEMADQEIFLETGEPMANTATGFLYAYPVSEEQDDKLQLWLVTCKHVVQPDEGDPPEEIMVRMNKSGDRGMQTFSISLRQDKGPKWTLHPEADVAVIPTSWSDLEEKGVQWETFAARRNTLRREDAKEEVPLREGDEVFILGFPIGWRQGGKDYPIVRHGMLAQIQGWLHGDHDTFLVDGSGHPGNSGGPVVTKPMIKAEVPRAWLIGMVSSVRLYRLGLTDLIEVIPMELIDETIVLAMQH